jgi:DNA-binding transcriptional LysR family regulator
VDLLRSDFDLAIRIGALADSTLVARRIAPSERVLVASPAYLEKNGTPSRPADLAAHTCLVFSYPGSLQNVWSLRSRRRRARVTVRGELRSDNGEVLRDWCLRGLGISMRETWDVVSELRDRSLVRILPAWEAEPTSIFAVRAPRTPLPYRISAFLDFITHRWRRPPWHVR